MKRMTDKEFNNMLAELCGDIVNPGRLGTEARRAREGEAAALDALDKIEAAWWKLVNGENVDSSQYKPARDVLTKAGRR